MTHCVGEMKKKKKHRSGDPSRGREKQHERLKGWKRVQLTENWWIKIRVLRLKINHKAVKISSFAIAIAISLSLPVSRAIHRILFIFFFFSRQKLAEPMIFVILLVSRSHDETQINCLVSKYNSIKLIAYYGFQRLERLFTWKQRANIHTHTQSLIRSETKRFNATNEQNNENKREQSRDNFNSFFFTGFLPHNG